MAAELVQAGVDALDGETVGRWRELAELRESPFLTPEWYSAWLAVHSDERPFLVLWRRDGELRGVLPLVSASRGPVRVLRAAGARRVDWVVPACRLEDEAEMGRDCAGLLAERRGDWRLLSLDRVDCESEWPEALWAGGEIAAARPRRTDVLPYIRFEDDGFEGYLRGRSRNLRSQLGRRRRRLEREHGLSFRLTSDPELLDADFDSFLRLHEARWQGRGGSSSATERVQAFHRRFAAAALRRGWLRLWIAEADGAPAAAWYGWRIGGRYCYALSGLDHAYERLSLGIVLLAHTIEQAAGEGATVYDLMWGDEHYKRRFETGRRTVASWVLGRPRQPLQVGSKVSSAVERALRDARGR